MQPVKAIAAQPGRPTPDDLLGELVLSLLAEKRLSRGVSCWLLDSILVATRTGKRLEDVMGLRETGKPSLQRRLMVIQRDTHLMKALAAVAFDDSLSAWDRCKRLAPEVRKFQSITWPRCHSLSSPPSDWNGCKQHLWHARKSGLELPESAHGLHAVAKGVGYSHNAKGAIFLAQIV